MMRNGKTLALTFAALVFNNRAFPITSDSATSPYRGIVERNVFDIHAAVPPKPPDPKDLLPPPPNIRLQGITDILGRKQVLFKVQLPPKPPAPAKEESFILTVGERQGELEVLDINPKEGTVQMKVYGVVTNLSLELNSDKLVNVAPVASPVPMSNPGQMTAPGALAPPPTLPTLPAGRFPRTLRLPGSDGAQNQSASGSSANYGGYGNQSQQPVRQASPEEQMINIEAQRILYKRQGNPLAETLPPLPPGIARGLGVEPSKPEEAPQ